MRKPPQQKPAPFEDLKEKKEEIPSDVETTLAKTSGGQGEKKAEVPEHVTQLPKDFRVSGGEKALG